MTPHTVPTSHGDFPAQSRNGTSRRALLRTGAWAAPAITLAGAAPAYARSTTPLPSALAVTQASWSRTGVARNDGGWLGTPGNGVPGIPGSNAISAPPSILFPSGFYSFTTLSSITASSFTAVWNVNVTSLKPLTVTTTVHAPAMNPMGLRQALVFTMSKGMYTETVGAAHHTTTSVAASVPAAPADSTAVGWGGVVTLSRTFTPPTTGLWNITATFSIGGEIVSMGAPQPFVLQTPSVAQAV